MAIQTFTAAQVLTAAQMNALQANDYNQTVSTKTASYTLVAADKGTRVVMNSASATTITVNTSLFSAGDTLFLQNISTGVCTVTAGTATVATAGSLAIPQNGSGTLYFTSAGVSIYYPSAGASGLTLVTAGTFSAVTTFTVDNVFTSAYRNYRILVHDTQVTGAGAQAIETKLRVGGVASSTTYFSARSGYQYTGSIAADVINNGTNWFIQRANGSGSSDGEAACSFDLYGPALAANTFFSGTAVDGSYQAAVAGYHNTATAYDGISFTLTTGATTFTGIYRIYGYQD